MPKAQPQAPRLALIGNSLLRANKLLQRKAERKANSKPLSFFKATEKRIKASLGYKNYLKTLPPEILSIVLNYLELKDQGALAATSIYFFGKSLIIYTSIWKIFIRRILNKEA